MTWERFKTKLFIENYRMDNTIKLWIIQQNVILMFGFLKVSHINDYKYTIIDL